MNLPRLRAFTLVELLVVVSIICVLLALLLPAIAMIRNKARKTQALERVTQISWALQNYASEDRRRRFPPQTADFTIRYDPTGVAPGNFNAVIDLNHRLDLTDFDKSGPAPREMLDPWKNPYQYMVDSDLTSDLTKLTPQRPLGVDGRTPPLDAWNVRGVRPYAYLWSTGPNCTTDGTGWIYRRDDK